MHAQCKPWSQRMTKLDSDAKYLFSKLHGLLSYLLLLILRRFSIWWFGYAIFNYIRFNACNWQIIVKLNYSGPTKLILRQCPNPERNHMKSLTTFYCQFSAQYELRTISSHCFLCLQMLDSLCHPYLSFRLPLHVQHFVVSSCFVYFCCRFCVMYSETDQNKMHGNSASCVISIALMATKGKENK